MTLEQILALAGTGAGRGGVIALLVGVPALAALLGPIHGPGRAAETPWRQIYSALVYLACVPGMLAATLTGYVLFFTRGDLLKVDLLVTLFPIVSMVATLVLIRRRVTFERLPGFDRLSGLMVVMAVTFAAALAIQKTRIWLIFGSSLVSLVLLVVGLFALLRWGSEKLLGRRPVRRDPPPHSPLEPPPPPTAG